MGHMHTEILSPDKEIVRVLFDATSSLIFIMLVRATFKVLKNCFEQSSSLLLIE